jgi:glycogen operon protein
MDSLRYWVTEMHVDGFRFDLASALAREFMTSTDSRLSLNWQQDPIVSQNKLIAEPWDVGPGGYQVGNFPPQWSEWNGKYRDTVRDFGVANRRHSGICFTVYRVVRPYERSGRRPVASINFVTAHDGFTLADLVSVQRKHNEANGENGNDGESHNRSWNSGVEGPTDDPEIRKLRADNNATSLALSCSHKVYRCFCMATNLAAHNQQQQQLRSRSSWVHWSHADVPLNEFTAAVNKLRKEHPTFRRSRFFDGRPVRRGEGEPLPDIVWLNSDAGEMAPEDWDAPLSRSVGVFLNGQGIRGQDHRGERVVDVNFLLYFNADDVNTDFTLPSEEYSAAWDVVIDTAGQITNSASLTASEPIRMLPKSLMVLRAHQPDAYEPDHSVAASLSGMSSSNPYLPANRPPLE